MIIKLKFNFRSTVPLLVHFVQHFSFAISRNRILCFWAPLLTLCHGSFLIELILEWIFLWSDLQHSSLHFTYPVVGMTVGASLHLATSSRHFFLSSALLRFSLNALPVHSVMLSSHLFVFLSFSFLVQFLAGLLRQVLWILWHVHTTLISVSSLWSEGLHEAPLRLWLCSIPQHLWCGLCMRCQGVCGSISSQLPESFSPIQLSVSTTHRHTRILRWPVSASVCHSKQASVLSSQQLFAQFWREFLVLILRLRELIQGIWSCWRSQVSRHWLTVKKALLTVKILEVKKLEGHFYRSV